MNEFYIRVLCLLVGGFLGYGMAMIRHTMKDTHEIRIAMEDFHKMMIEDRRKGEAGFFRFSPYLVGWISVVLLVAVSVFSTARTNSVLAETQRSDARSQACTEQFLGATVRALNERTQFTSAQSAANIELQEAQLRFLTVIARPGDAGGEEALSEYLDALRKYSGLVAASRGKVEDFPYPESDDYNRCLRDSVTD